MNTKILSVFLLLLVGLAQAPTVSAQAFCALRDPVKAIYQLHPEADSYRSIVRTIGDPVRLELAKRLPFSLHFNELGRHTLYVAAADSRPVGLVHVRSEIGPWGMVEIAWSFDCDLRIAGFSFQRCRSSGKAELLSEEAQQALRGLTGPQVRKLVSEDGRSLATDAFSGLSAAGRDLALIVVRSALKTIEVTKLAWGDDLRVLAMLDHAYASFPNGESVELVEQMYSGEVIDEIDRYLDSANGNGIDRKKTTGLRVRGNGGEVIGHIIRTPWSSMGQDLALWWNVTPDLTINEVIPEGDWPDAQTQQAFREARGISFADLAHCQTAAQIVGAEVLILSRSIEGGM